jgi:hypothetical protein
MVLTLSDFFVVGLGVEVVGAWLIARGLLAPLPLLKSFGTYGGIGAADVVDRARNRVDAWFGVIYLLIGFLAQLAGYLLEIGGDDPSQGTCRLIGAIVGLALGIGSSCGLWALLHERAFKALLVAIAFAPLRTDGQEIEEGRDSCLARLAEYAKAAEGGAELYESNESYLCRLYGNPEELAAPRSWWWPGSWHWK